MAPPEGRVWALGGEGVTEMKADVANEGRKPASGGALARCPSCSVCEAPFYTLGSRSKSATTCRVATSRATSTRCRTSICPVVSNPSSSKSLRGRIPSRHQRDLASSGRALYDTCRFLNDRFRWELSCPTHPVFASAESSAATPSREDSTSRTCPRPASKHYPNSRDRAKKS